jgi:hypothetical protein
MFILLVLVSVVGRLFPHRTTLLALLKVEVKLLFELDEKLDIFDSVVETIVLNDVI